MTEVIVPLDQVFVRPEDVEELGWQDQALCAQTDPEAFFPERAARPGRPSASVGAARSGPVPGVRAGERREVRHLGRSVRTRTAADQAPGGLGHLTESCRRRHPAFTLLPQYVLFIFGPRERGGVSFTRPRALAGRVHAGRPDPRPARDPCQRTHRTPVTRHRGYRRARRRRLLPGLSRPCRRRPIPLQLRRGGHRKPGPQRGRAGRADRPGRGVRHGAGHRVTARPSAARCAPTAARPGGWGRPGQSRFEWVWLLHDDCEPPLTPSSNCSTRPAAAGRWRFSARS